APRDAIILARLTLATAAVHETTLGSNDVAEPNPLIGIADVNGDGCDDAIVTVGQGASTVWTSFLVYADGALRRVEENGAPVMFNAAQSAVGVDEEADRKSTRLNSSHSQISYAVFCLKKKKKNKAEKIAITRNK